MATTTPPKDTPMKSPVNACAKARAKMSKKEIKEGDYSLNDWMAKFKEFINSVVAESYCVDMRGRHTECTCMKALAYNDKLDCAYYLEGFARMTKDERQKIVLDWMKYAHIIKWQTATHRSSALAYLLPGCNDVLICANACARLIGFGDRAWKTVSEAYKGGTVPCHGLTGKSANNTIKEYDNLLHDFFIKLEGLASPRATQVVRDIVNGKATTSTRDDEEEENGRIELPTYYTKRSLYKKLAADCKWEVYSTNSGNYKKQQKLQESVVDKLPSWGTFYSFWQKHYKHIKIPKPREDICEDCHKYVNYHKTTAGIKESRKRRAEEAALDEEDDIDSDAEQASNSAGSTAVASVPSLGAEDDGEL